MTDHLTEEDIRNFDDVDEERAQYVPDFPSAPIDFHVETREEPAPEAPADIALVERSAQEAKAYEERMDEITNEISALMEEHASLSRAHGFLKLVVMSGVKSHEA